MPKDPPEYSYEYAKEFLYKEIGSPYMVDAYNLNIVESALLRVGKKVLHTSCGRLYTMGNIWYIAW